jgi:uncharacterized protein YpiB (UPF0302 family)
MKTIKVQDETHKILVKLSKKLKIKPEALVDRVISEIQKGYLLKQITESETHNNRI